MLHDDQKHSPKYDWQKKLSNDAISQDITLPATSQFWKMNYRKEFAFRVDLESTQEGFCSAFAHLCSLYASNSQQLLTLIASFDYFITNQETLILSPIKTEHLSAMRDLISLQKKEKITPPFLGGDFKPSGLVAFCKKFLKKNHPILVGGGSLTEIHSLDAHSITLIRSEEDKIELWDANLNKLLIICTEEEIGNAIQQSFSHLDSDYLVAFSSLSDAPYDWGALKLFLDEYCVFNKLYQPTQQHLAFLYLACSNEQLVHYFLKKIPTNPKILIYGLEHALKLHNVKIALQYLLYFDGFDSEIEQYRTLITAELYSQRDQHNLSLLDYLCDGRHYADVSDRRLFKALKHILWVQNQNQIPPFKLGHEKTEQKDTPNPLIKLILTCNKKMFFLSMLEALYRQGFNINQPFDFHYFDPAIPEETIGTLTQWLEIKSNHSLLYQLKKFGLSSEYKRVPEEKTSLIPQIQKACLDMDEIELDRLLKKIAVYGQSIIQDITIDGLKIVDYALYKGSLALFKTVLTHMGLILKPHYLKADYFTQHATKETPENSVAFLKALTETPTQSLLYQLICCTPWSIDLSDKLNILLDYLSKLTDKQTLNRLLLPALVHVYYYNQKKQIAFLEKKGFTVCDSDLSHTSSFQYLLREKIHRVLVKTKPEFQTHNLYSLLAGENKKIPFSFVDLQMAIEFHINDFLRFAMKHRCIVSDLFDDRGNTLLHIAIRSNNISAAHDLLKDKNWNLLNDNQEGQTPFQLAIQHQEWVLVSLMLSHNDNAILQQYSIKKLVQLGLDFSKVLLPLSYLIDLVKNDDEALNLLAEQGYQFDITLFYLSSTVCTTPISYQLCRMVASVSDEIPLSSPTLPWVIPIDEAIYFRKKIADTSLHTCLFETEDESSYDQKIPALVAGAKEIKVSLKQTKLQNKFVCRELIVPRIINLFCQEQKWDAFAPETFVGKESDSSVISILSKREAGIPLAKLDPTTAISRTLIVNMMRVLSLLAILNQTDLKPDNLIIRGERVFAIDFSDTLLTLPYFKKLMPIYLFNELTAPLIVNDQIVKARNRLTFSFWDAVSKNYVLCAQVWQDVIRRFCCWNLEPVNEIAKNIMDYALDAGQIVEKLKLTQQVIRDFYKIDSEVVPKIAGSRLAFYKNETEERELCSSSSTKDDQAIFSPAKK